MAPRLMYGPHRFNIPQQCRLPMTEADIQHGKQLLQDAKMWVDKAFK